MIFIVVPAYNEEKNIGRVVRGLFDSGFKNVVVVNDGSKDKTLVEARAAGAIVINHIFNRGQGATLQTGDEYCLKAGADKVIHFDGDGQFDPKDIGPAVKEMESAGVEVLFGSRFLDNRSEMPFLKKYFILPVGRFVNFLFTGIWLSDAHNGFRILNKRALSLIKITQSGMAHNSEILAEVKKFGLSYQEFPIKVSYSRYGQGIKGGFKIIRDLVVSWFVK